MNLENLIKRIDTRILALYMKLDDEISPGYVDRKDRQPEINILKTIAKYEGFKLGLSYMGRTENPVYYDTNKYFPGSLNSIIDNQRENKND